MIFKIIKEQEIIVWKSHTCTVLDFTFLLDHYQESPVIIKDLQSYVNTKLLPKIDNFLPKFKEISWYIDHPSLLPPLQIIQLILPNDSNFQN